MTDRSWKALERRLARKLGTRRIPVTGERAGADFVDGLFAYQAKLGRRCPAYLRRWLAGIVAAGARRNRVGVVVWKPKGSRDRDALVVVRFHDWCELHVGRPDRLGGPAMPQEGLGTLSQATICGRPGCGSVLPPGPRRGSPRRFCSPGCRRRAWRAARP